MQLKDKTVIVTGGGRGIGKALSIAFAGEGANVVITSRTKDQLDEVAKEISDSGGNVLAINADVTDRTAVEALVNRTVEEYSRIDILVNNAGINPRGLFLDSTDEEWDQVWQVNVMAVVHCCRSRITNHAKNKVVVISSILVQD